MVKLSNITKYIQKEKYLLIALVIAFLAGMALLHPGLPPTHDGEYHVIRFYEFDKVLRDGNWYPRWAPDLNFGYGVPLFTYVYPLPNYVASFLHVLGSGFIDGFKIQMLLATLCGGLFFYLFAKEFWGEKGGFIASAFYTFSPYHFVDIYVRGSVGEVWALGLFPFFLWSYTKYTKTFQRKFFILSAVSLTLIIFSHNILALMFFCFVLFYMLFLTFQSLPKKQLLLTSFILILLSLGLSSVFWMPALFQTNLVTGLQIYDIQKNFPDLFQLLFPSWGTGFFDNNLNNQMSVQIGTANLLAVIGVIILFIKNWEKHYENKNVIGFFLLSYVGVFFLLTPFSKPLWTVLPLLHYFQFPWRLLSLMILICSFLAGSFFAQKRSLVWVGVFLIVLFLTTYDYAHPTFYHLRNDDYYTSRSNFIDGTNSPGNAFQTIWTPVFSQRAQNASMVVKGNGEVVRKEKTPTKQTFFIHIQTPSDISFPLSYFPEWKATANNQPIPVKNAHGLVSISLPKGEYHVSLFPRLTPIEVIAQMTSLLSLILLILIACNLSFVRKLTEIL